MYVIGFLAAAAIIFYLPGAISHRLFDLRFTGVSKAIFIVCSSLSISYLLAGSLMVAGLWGPFFFWSLVLVEVLLFFSLARPSLQKIRHTFDKPKNLQIDFPISLLAAVAIVWALERSKPFLVDIKNSVQEPFLAWDAVVSWNRWAVAWFSGSDLNPLYHYPQLVPISWAQIYTGVGGAIEYFAKFPIIVLFILAIICALKTIRVHSLLPTLGGLGVCLGFIHAWMGSYFFSGYVDAFVLSLGMIWLFVFLEKSSSPAEKVFLLCIVSGAAASIKQGGLFFYPATIALLVHYRDAIWKSPRAVRYMTFLALTLPILIFLALHIRTRLGLDRSEIVLVTALAAEGRSVFIRLANAGQYAIDHLGWYLPFAALAYTRLLAVTSGVERLALALLVIPSLIIWPLFYSYDGRNIAPVVGVLAVITAQFVSILIDRLLQSEKTAVFATVVIIAAMAFGIHHSSHEGLEALQKRQVEQFMHRGDLKANEWLKGLPATSRILTFEYPFVLYIGELAATVQNIGTQNFEETTDAFKNLKACNIDFILIPHRTSCATCDTFNHSIATEFSQVDLGSSLHIAIQSPCHNP